MSRNSDRLGPSVPEQAETPPQMTQNEGGSGGFSFVVPTEFVDLPSKGRFYNENHPLYNQDTIEIKQMTAKEEDLLTSRALLKKGVVLDRVMKSIIIDKRVSPDSLLVGDRNAIMIAARISGYGNEYNTKVACPSCSTTQEYSFDLLDSTVDHGSASTELGVKEIGGGLFSTILPKTQCDVTFRLLFGDDERLLLNRITGARKKNKEENAITTQLRLLTHAINGDTSPQTINYFVENVPTLDAHHLRAAFAIATPNVDLTQYFTCNECGYDAEMEVPLTADFFWPKR